MKLSPMRYKDFTWPYNPRTYTIEYRRAMGEHKVPFGRYHLQDLGPTRRVMKGEGEFVGPKAYDTFKALASVFYSDGPGVLLHPVWQSANVYFVELSLTQEPRQDYVRYTFTFWEGYEGYRAYARSLPETAAGEAGETTGAAGDTAGETGGSPGPILPETAPAGEVWHTVRSGESLWKISGDYGESVEAVIARNPQLKNPNLIHPGEQVRVR